MLTTINDVPDQISVADVANL